MSDRNFIADPVAKARDLVARAPSQQVRVMDFRVEDPLKRLRTVPAGELDNAE